jgi:superfamily II DNA or RNA helicase
MWITIEAVWCAVTNATPEEEGWASRYLAFENGSGFGRRIVTSLYNPVSKKFPGGLLPLLLDAAKRDGIKVELLDKRTTRVQVNAQADLTWLRDYQLAAVDACVRERRGIVRAPTGSGKTEIIVGVVQRLPGRWMFVVHRDNLVDQAAKRYTLRTGLRPNILSRLPPAEWVVQPGLNLMTLQSLASGIRRDRKAVDAQLASLDGVLVDECHVAPANVYFNAINRCPAEYRLGFSGTPLDRSDNRSLMAIAALGKVIYNIKAQTLIDAGMLAMPEVTMVRVVHAKGQAVGNWAHDYEKLVVDSEVRNDAVIATCQVAAKPCMLFVKLIDHGQALKKRLEEAGLRAEFVWGSKSAEQRAAAVERLERGDSDVLVASVVFQEGVDVPSLRSVVIASGGRSVIAALQRVGRGMRTDGGKKAAFSVFDFLDQGSPMLERHSRRRMNTYVREGYRTVLQGDHGMVEYKPKLRTRREIRETEAKLAQ